MDDKKIWFSILVVGIFFHTAAALVMPLGLDAYVHLNYVTDGIDDGSPSLDWGEIRTNGAEYSTPEEVSADDRWMVWHAIIGLWIAVFGNTLASLHMLSLVIFLLTLTTVYWCTSRITNTSNALALTAICAIYSPLIRATGRLYQENIILLLATLIIFGLLQIKWKKRPTLWASIAFFSLMAIMSIKGLNPAFAIILFTPPAIIAIKEFEIKPIGVNFVILSCIILSATFTILRGEELSIDTAYFIFNALFIGGFIYLFMATLIFISDMRQRSKDSDYLVLLTQLCFIGLIAYIVMLLEVEKSSLQATAVVTAEQFSYIFRYLSVLIVPMWWSYFLRSKDHKLTVNDNPSRFAMAFALLIMVSLNVSMLNTTGGMEAVGKEIADEVETGDNILYVSEPYHAMHRLYTLQITVDPDHDRQVRGYWADSGYNWSGLIEEHEITWVIFTDEWDSYLDDDWTIFETNTDYLVFHKKSGA